MPFRWIASAAVAAFVIAGGASASDLPGTVWATQGGQSHVEFALDGDGKLVGRFVWLQDEEESGEPVMDTENPDETLNGRPLIGAAFVYGFSAKGEDWVGGRIYDPRDGKTYRSKIEPGENGALNVKGCVGPFCQTQIWTPIAETSTGS